jgi:hypothetical protein
MFNYRETIISLFSFEQALLDQLSGNEIVEIKPL